MTKLCECGCGEPAPIARYTHTPRGWVKGQPKRFIAGHTRRQAKGTDADYALDPNGCWLWQHGCDPNGYGCLTVNYKTVMAHRWVWERLRGPIADGLHLHHTCEVPRCVNPNHLVALTPSEHCRVHRTVVCSKGHPRTPENTYTRPNGNRTCRPCRYASEHARAQAREHRPICAAVKQNGVPCVRSAMGGSDYCVAHDPARRALRGYAVTA